MTASAIRSATHALCTRDGIMLAARVYEPAAADSGGHAPRPSAVVLVHGFAGSKDQPAVVATATALAELGHHVLVYDGRGHGRSGGACTLGDAERFDVEAAVHRALDTADDIVLVGASMGGIAVLNHLADGGPARGGVVASTPARWEIPRTARGALSVVVTQTAAGRAAAARLWNTRVAAQRTRDAPPLAQIARAGRPIAVVHGTHDRFVPVAAARVLHDAAGPPRSIEIVPNMGHGYCVAAIGPIASAVDWILGCPGRSAAEERQGP